MVTRLLSHQVPREKCGVRHCSCEKMATHDGRRCVNCDHPVHLHIAKNMAKEDVRIVCDCVLRKSKKPCPCYAARKSKYPNRVECRCKHDFWRHRIDVPLDQRGNQCHVCSAQPATSTVQNCGHTCICPADAAAYKRANTKCPQCLTILQDIVGGDEAADDADLNESGLDPDEITTVMQQAACSRSQAVEALKRYGSVVDAILVCFADK